MPRKLSAVSAMIICGIARVRVAMMWLTNDGTMWLTITCCSLQPSSLAATTKSWVAIALVGLLPLPDPVRRSH